MKISLYLSVLLLAFVVKIATANVRLQRSPQQYCGSRLADIMKMICKNKYNGPKRSPAIDSDVWDYKDLEDYNAIGYPFIPMNEALSFMPSRLLRPAKRSIIDECCHRPCYLAELKTYCASQ
ncbi:bombyxin C-2-like [Myzus persicae]|uniref:bombyxin C-2-like n=1 Tax=Myzus persicae TaxID=13164 RepID=UPI000B93179E|nr:bombyxin C-2-like [Myzus persicae]